MMCQQHNKADEHYDADNIKTEMDIADSAYRHRSSGMHGDYDNSYEPEFQYVMIEKASWRSPECSRWNANRSPN